MRVAGPVHANSGRFLEALAVAGVGMALEPDFIVGPDVRAGRLVPILQAFAPPPSSIYVVYPSRRHLSAKVRAFSEFLAERFAQPTWALPATTQARARALRRGSGVRIDLPAPGTAGARGRAGAGAVDDSLLGCSCGSGLRARGSGVTGRLRR